MPVQEPSGQQQHVLAPRVLPPTFIKAAARIVACEWLHTYAICSCSISWLGCSASCRSPHRLLLPCLHLMLAAAAGSAGTLHMQLLPMVADIQMWLPCSRRHPRRLAEGRHSAGDCRRAHGAQPGREVDGWQHCGGAAGGCPGSRGLRDWCALCQPGCAGCAPCNCWHHGWDFELYPGGHHGQQGLLLLQLLSLSLQVHAVLGGHHSLRSNLRRNSGLVMWRLPLCNCSPMAVGAKDLAGRNQHLGWQCWQVELEDALHVTDSRLKCHASPEQTAGALAASWAVWETAQEVSHAESAGCAPDIAWEA